MTNLSLNMGFSPAKEYAIGDKLPDAQQQQKKVEQEVVHHGARQSGVEWLTTSSDEVKLSQEVTDSTLLLATSSTETSAKALKSSSSLGGLKENLKQKFKNLFVSSYSNSFSHNLLLSKVAEWSLGYQMEMLEGLGLSREELEDIKSNVRFELIEKNHVAMEQLNYDDFMLRMLT